MDSAESDVGNRCRRPGAILIGQGNSHIPYVGYIGPLGQRIIL